MQARLKSQVKMFLAAVLLGTSPHLYSQTNPDFNVSLRIDYASIDGLINLKEGLVANVNNVAKLRGNQIAAATSALLARQQYTPDDFSRELERFRDGTTSSFDIYGLKSTLQYFDKVKALLAEVKKRQLDRRIVATIAQFFPQDADITINIPVYFVALGHENAAAYVRRIVWNGNTPRFVGEGQGELTIVVNLTRSCQFIQEVQMQFIDMMSTLAHETFHAAFGVYKDTSPVWRSIEHRPEPYWTLAELVQNEGIAYLISLQTHGSSRLSEQQLAAATRTVGVLNSALKELSSPGITSSRARDLILNSNLSGGYESNYGATAGLLMAYAIDSKLGRNALTETIKKGVGDFFSTYNELTQSYGELPKFDDAVIQALQN